MMLALLFVCLIGLGVSAYFYTRAKERPRLAGAAKLRQLQEAQRGRREQQGSPVAKVEAGGVLHLDNVGLRSESLDLQVVARHVHKEGTARWVELEAEAASGKMFLTVAGEQDPELSLGLVEVDPRSVGADPENLEQGRAPSSLTYEGTEFALREQGQAQYCPQGNELEAEAYEYWDYAALEDDFQTFSLVCWRDGGAEGYYGVKVPARDVTVYSSS